MNHIIIYPNQHGCLTFLYPAANTGMTIQEMARKDVPAGVPYLLVPDEQVPRDHTFFDAFEADFSAPDGHGIGPQAWFIEKYTQERDSLDPANNQGHIAYLNNIIESLRAEINQ